MMYGAVTIEKAKISGIMPAELTRSGICVLCPCVMRRRTTRLAYCTGMRRCASCTKTIAAMTSAETMRQDHAPERSGWPATAARLRLGRRAMMPAKMISETPLPIPFSVINSPSQIRNIVPAVR